MDIRLATPTDAAAINAIYVPNVADSAASFEFVPPTDAEMAGRISRSLTERPWFVAEESGEILGYAYASRHRERPGYQWSVETSVYVHPGHQRRGIAHALYRELFQQLANQGYYNAFAVITLPNAASIALHESFDFAPVGIYRNAGFKLGRWWDVGWWQKPLRPYAAPIATSAPQVRKA